MAQASTQGAELVELETLLEPKQGQLFKLGGGGETGNKWNRRWFVLRDNALLYFNARADYSAFRTKPSGVVLLEECSVRHREPASSYEALLRPHTFVISHPSGESVVLAAESEREMLEWMQAVRTARLCVVDAEAAKLTEARRQESARVELADSEKRRALAIEELDEVERDLASLQLDIAQVEAEKDQSERELKELMARFKLRKSLLHWRHRKLTLTFRALLTVVFRDRIDKAERRLSSAKSLQQQVDDEASAAATSLRKAETARRKAGKLYATEIELKKAVGTDTRECEKLLTAESRKIEQAHEEEARLIAAGAQSVQLEDSREEVLQLQLMLDRCKAESELIQQQLRRRALQATAAASVADNSK